LRDPSSKGLTLALGVLLAATLVLRPVAYGLALGSVAVFWTFVLLAVGVPGVALCWAAGWYRKDAALLVGQGLTLGLALQGMLFLAGRALGVEGLAHALPFLALGVAAAAARQRKRIDASTGIPQAARGLLLVALVACLLQPLVSLRLLGVPLPVDLLYHAGNAAELSHRWPLEDPRVAGLPLNYPVLAYAVPVETARLGSLPVADALSGSPACSGSGSSRCKRTTRGACCWEIFGAPRSGPW
jgi:hypothetical protein